MIRLAHLADAEAIREIYAPSIREGAISFEYEVPTMEEMQRRIHEVLRWAPWLVFEERQRVLAYAYASRHRERAAYQWSVETSVYVHPDGRRRGLARQLYIELFERLRKQGFYGAYAGVTLPNPASVSLHESLGFKPVGIYEKVGYKGAWRDVGWWQLELAPRVGEPIPPRAHRVDGTEFNP